MFKVGDWVVGTALTDNRLFEYEYELPELKMAVVTKDGRTVGLSQLRHATSEEIAAGHRIDCETLDHPEDYTSPNCKKFDERVK